MDPDPVRAALARSRHARTASARLHRPHPACCRRAPLSSRSPASARCWRHARGRALESVPGRHRSELELDRGIAANIAVLAVGALLCGLVVLAAAYAAVGASVHECARRPSRPRVARWETRVGAPTDVALGTHFALDRPRSPARLRAAAGDRGRSGRDRDRRGDRDAPRQRRSLVHDARRARVAVGRRDRQLEFHDHRQGRRRAPRRSSSVGGDSRALRPGADRRSRQLRARGSIRWHRTARCRLRATTGNVARDRARRAPAPRAAQAHRRHGDALGRRRRFRIRCARTARPERLTIVGTAAAPTPR